MQHVEGKQQEHRVFLRKDIDIKPLIRIELA